MHPGPMPMLCPQTKTSCTEEYEKTDSRLACNLSMMGEPSANEKSKDGRKESRGGGMIETHINEFEASAIDFFEREECLPVSDFVKKCNLLHKIIKYFGGSKTEWRYPPTKLKMLQLVSYEKHKNHKRRTGGLKPKKYPRQETESELCRLAM